ncbi:expressed unknown protein [Seminavis robusta]|uniref:Uncharacterized protein n=1 Tax=Seminavis robusta TaxID=568900 RepID=A0A9N8E5H2_9STRA|nr:expressed unknown protein [Seminavis robusta]|eukprot:Sro681_g186410.1 n/a (837) ;mRNA; r:26101-28709
MKRSSSDNTTTTNNKKMTLFPAVYYYSKSSSSQHPVLKTNDLPHEPNHVGMKSPYYFLWASVFAVVPVAYCYIALILLREVGLYWHDTVGALLQEYTPWVWQLLQLSKASRWMELWCCFEALFFFGLKCHVYYLSSRDPLEQSLSSAPFMKHHERALLWHRMMDAESNPAEMISGWFFDQPIEALTTYDVREFITWSMFEGRNQEHLTRQELQQLQEFVEMLEYKISEHWYGTRPEVESSMDEQEQQDTIVEEEESSEENSQEAKETTPKMVPRKMFHFPEPTEHEPPNFFSNLYESYRRSYGTYKKMIVEKSPMDMNKNLMNFHPVEDFKNFMASTTQQILEAEEFYSKAASQTAESARQAATETAHNISTRVTQTTNHMYSTIVQPGSAVERRLQQTQTQLIHAFSVMKESMTERLETAKFLAGQRKIITQQLRGYREMLDRLRFADNSSASQGVIPSQQMAALMRRITESNQALERLEAHAKSAFDQATGFVAQHTTQQQPPQRYAKYSSDPLLGIAMYPLGFHLLLLGATELPLRVMMHRKGFERRSIGPVNYYFHPGTHVDDDDDSDDEDDDNTSPFHDDHNNKNTPLVFVHGIGIGLITYQPLIDAMLQSGRPIFLPELPFVSGFRPWQGPNAVLPPAVVCSTMTAMLATHGYLKGAFCGHSYGTSWLSYMCKYAPTAVAALLFLDPICFCLHAPRLTKKFVYHRPDPGTISYIIRTDLIVNWTIQRSFPWAWIILFTEQIHVPCAVFLSEQDALVPAQKVEEYLRHKDVPVSDFVPGMKFDNDDINDQAAVTGCVFRGHGHGDWTDYPTDTVPVIADCLQNLCDRAEQD